MNLVVIALMFFFVSCASFEPGRAPTGAYVPPALGPQMDSESLRDFHFDRLR